MTIVVGSCCTWCWFSTCVGVGVMFGTTLPTEGTGLVINGDMDGILASWASKVTPPSLFRSFPSPPSVERNIVSIQYLAWTQVGGKIYRFMGTISCDYNYTWKRCILEAFGIHDSSRLTSLLSFPCFVTDSPNNHVPRSTTTNNEIFNAKHHASVLVQDGNTMSTVNDFYIGPFEHSLRHPVFRTTLALIFSTITEHAPRSIQTNWFQQYIDDLFHLLVPSHRSRCK